MMVTLVPSRTVRANQVLYYLILISRRTWQASWCIFRHRDTEHILIIYSGTDCNTPGRWQLYTRHLHTGLYDLTLKPCFFSTSIFFMVLWFYVSISKTWHSKWHEVARDLVCHIDWRHLVNEVLSEIIIIIPNETWKTTNWFHHLNDALIHYYRWWSKAWLV